MNTPPWLVRVAKFSSPFALFGVFVLYARTLDGFAGIGWVVLGLLVSFGLLVSLIVSEFSQKWFIRIISFVITVSLLYAALTLL